MATAPFLSLVLHRFSSQHHEGKGLESAPAPSEMSSLKVSKAGFMHFIDDGRKWI